MAEKVKVKAKIGKKLVKRRPENVLKNRKEGEIIIILKNNGLLRGR